MQRVRGERGALVRRATRATRRPCARRRCTITTPITTSAYHVASTGGCAPPASRAIARQTITRLASDEDRGLAERGEVLRLAVPVLVAEVGRARRDADREERQQRRDEIGARVRRLREQAEAVVARPVPSFSAISATAANTEMSAAFLRWMHGG